MRFVPYFQAAVLTVCLASSVLANDGIGSLGLGGVVLYGKTDTVAMRKEVLEIGTKRIDVSYEFVNESAEPVTLPVVFPLPPYGAAEESLDTYCGQPVDFSLLVNGKEQPFQTSIRAVCRGHVGHVCQKGIDITEDLRALGLTPSQIAILPGAFKEKNRVLKAKKIVSSDGSKPAAQQPENTREVDVSRFESQQPISPRVTAEQILKLRERNLLDERDYPIWEAHITYAWTLTFPSGKVVAVRHSYAPFLGLGSVSDVYVCHDSEHAKTEFADVCPSSELADRLIALAQTKDPCNGIPLRGAKLEYILTTANTWKGPIKDFTLRLKRNHPNEIISLCFPGAFIPKDDITMESHVENFSPSSNLLIRFFDPTDSVQYDDGKRGTLPNGGGQWGR